MIQRKRKGGESLKEEQVETQQEGQRSAKTAGKWRKQLQMKPKQLEQHLL